MDHPHGALLAAYWFPAFLRITAGSLRGLPDAARIQMDGAALVFSTGSFVMQPLEFSGGDIGSLAVHGAVNNIAAGGSAHCFHNVNRLRLSILKPCGSCNR